MNQTSQPSALQPPAPHIRVRDLTVSYGTFALMRELNFDIRRGEIFIIMGGSGCKARAIYDGEVSAVLSYAGTVVVMLRHGAYISVYSNLSSASVSRGQKVSTRQVIGTVGPDHILQFQLRKERAKLNPEAWLGR